MSETLATTLVERLEAVGCDRAPFTDAHKHCICRLANEAAREITKLQQLGGKHILDASRQLNNKDAEITKLKSQLEEARRGLKIALHALKNVDGPFIEHEGAHGIFLAKEHDCTCWDAEQTVTAFLNGSAK